MQFSSYLSNFLIYYLLSTITVRYETYDEIMEVLPKLPRPVLISFTRGATREGGAALVAVAAAAQQSSTTPWADQQPQQQVIVHHASGVNGTRFSLRKKWDVCK